MMYRCLIFDRVRVSRVVPDGKAFKVYVENIGEGRAARGAVRVEVSDTAVACLDEPVEAFVRKTIRRMANAHENDGRKVDALVERGTISLDSQYVGSTLNLPNWDAADRQSAESLLGRQPVERHEVVGDELTAREHPARTQAA